MSSPARQRPNFDHIARVYRWLEYLALGPLLERVRFHHLPRLVQELSSPATALILGDGDGRFTALLLSPYPQLSDPQLSADVVDLSPAMLALLEDRCMASAPQARDRLQLHQQDALDFVAANLPKAAYDLVVTHFFLDCLQQAEVEHLVRNIAPALTPGALWLVSEFRIPQGILHWPARFYIRALYLAFRLLTGLRTTHLPDHASVLDRAGLRVIASHRALFGLLTTDLWQMSREHGSTGAPPQPEN